MSFFKLFELIFIIFVIPISLFRQKLQSKSKVVILYGVEYFYYVVPFIIFGLLLNIKIYRVITDRYNHNVISPIWWKKPKVFFYNIQYRYFDRFLDGIICLSSYLCEGAIKQGVSEDRILLVPHFIDVSYFSQAVAPPFSNEHKVKIGMCGSLTEQNGLFVLIESFIRLKEQLPET